MPRLTSNSVSMSLRMLYLSCVKIRWLRCPAKTELALGAFISLADETVVLYIDTHWVSRCKVGK